VKPWSGTFDAERVHPRVSTILDIAEVTPNPSMSVADARIDAALVTAISTVHCAHDLDSGRVVAGSGGVGREVDSRPGRASAQRLSGDRGDHGGSVLQPHLPIFEAFGCPRLPQRASSARARQIAAR
jgi:hypothetical protein